MPLHGLWGTVDSTTQQFARAPAHKLAQMKGSDLPAAAPWASSGADGAAGGRSTLHTAGKTGKRLASQAAQHVTKAELEALYYLPLSAAAKHIGVRALATRTQLQARGLRARVPLAFACRRNVFGRPRGGAPCARVGRQACRAVVTHGGPPLLVAVYLV